MALFKLRKKVDEPKAAASPTESIEAVRRRARHRLIGAAVLVLAGVVGFPLLFDTQPRPVAVDIPIEIPDRNKVKPLAPPPAAPAAAVGKVTPAPAPAASVATAPSAPPPAPARTETPVITEKAEPADKVAKVEPVPEKKPEPKAETRTDTKVASAAETAKARALLEGRSVDAEAGARYVVQVGAFSERDKAKVAQQKLERAGLKNYTNVAETKDGKRIRVRAGPFASRAEADKAAEKIKGLDLPAAVLTL